MKLEHSLTPYTKRNSKWIKDLNVRLYTIKCLEENKDVTLFDINHSDIFLDPSPKVMETKARVNKWDLMKLKTFFTAKEIINKMKRQPTGWEKVFANDMIDEGLISNIYINSSYNSTSKINSKWVKDLNVRQDTIKLLEENIGRTLYDINHSKILFDTPPREMEIKRKINKWDQMKLKSFCTAKETINKTKRQLKE